MTPLNFRLINPKVNHLLKCVMSNSFQTCSSTIVSIFIYWRHQWPSYLNPESGDIYGSSLSFISDISKYYRLLQKGILGCEFFPVSARPHLHFSSVPLQGCLLASLLPVLPPPPSAPISITAKWSFCVLYQILLPFSAHSSGPSSCLTQNLKSSLWSVTTQPYNRWRCYLSSPLQGGFLPWFKVHIKHRALHACSSFAWNGIVIVESPSSHERSFSCPILRCKITLELAVPLACFTLSDI